ncbi:glycosyltransferase family 4 protein, partial [Candidatus Uhrbacteria bacterium]|nr:glycosyltransferase family 4 protein [Candidatus Uhrbacteria bacterium]
LFIIPHSYFLYVGRIEAKKNLHVIIDAFQKLRRAKKIPDDMQLILVGRRGYQSEATLKAAQEKGGGTIRYLSWVPSATLQELYRGATAFLFPSLYEGFGFPVLEALSYGVPVIASDIPALREIGGSAPTFVSPTVDSFREAMAAIASRTPTERERAQWKTHTAQFSWETAAKKTLTVLGNAL